LTQNVSYIRSSLCSRPFM